MPVSSKPRAKPRVEVPLNELPATSKTAQGLKSRSAAVKKRAVSVAELEKIIAERFGCPVAQVVVRGDPPEWDATLILPRAGNAEKHGRFWTLVYGMKGEFGLAG